MNRSSAVFKAKLYSYQLPFLKPLVFNGRRLSQREGLIVQLQAQDGRLSFGEIAPLPGFSRETLAQAKKQIVQLLERGLENRPPDKILYPSVHFALDAALTALPLDTEYKQPDSIALLQGEHAEIIDTYRALNMPPLIKLKVGRGDPDSDILLFNRLAGLNSALQIRCDANQSWSSAQAAYFFAHIDTRQLDYIEEPTASYAENLQLAQQYQIALGLDESLQQQNFCYRHHPCIKALVLKPTLTGSLQRLQHFIDIAAKQQLQLHLSSSFESIIALQQLASLAHRCRDKCSISLGCDTLKYFKGPLLTDIKQIERDLQQLECLWQSS